MALPDNLAKLLKPIPGSSPTGTNMRRDGSPINPFQNAKAARTAARGQEKRLDNLSADERAKESPPDWRAVIKHASECLEKKSKDLEIVAYMVEAQLRVNGFAGLRDGFELARLVVETFWEKVFPELDDEAESMEEKLEPRLKPLAGLNGMDAEGTLLVPIRRGFLTDSPNKGQLEETHFQNALRIRNTPAKDSAQEKAIKSLGGPWHETFPAAVNETPAPFYGQQVKAVKGCIEEWKKLADVVEKKAPEFSFPTAAVREGLEKYLDRLKEVGSEKLAGLPPDDDEQPPPAEDEADDKSADDAKAPAPKAPAAAEGKFVSVAANVAPGQIVVQEKIVYIERKIDEFESRTKAIEAIEGIARFFRRSEPQSLIPYQLEQAVRWAKMSTVELLQELIPDDAPRKSMFKQVGIKGAEGAAAPAPAAAPAAKK
jgi:type VI secretion system protein ImpA